MLRIAAFGFLALMAPTVIAQESKLEPETSGNNQVFEFMLRDEFEDALAGRESVPEELAYIIESIDGIRGTSFVDAFAQEPNCSRAGKRQTHVLLVGAPPFEAPEDPPDWMVRLHKDAASQNENELAPEATVSEPTLDSAAGRIFEQMQEENRKTQQQMREVNRDSSEAFRQFSEQERDARVNQATANSISLFRQALIARGVRTENVTVLQGLDAQRDATVEAIAAISKRAQCGDSVFLHFVGSAFSSLGVKRDGYEPASGDQFDRWIELSDFAGETDREGSGDLFLRRGPFLAFGEIERADEGIAGNKITNVLSAQSLSDMVLLLRNLQLDVTVSIDANNAALFRIEERQATADPAYVTRVNAYSWKCEDPTSVNRNALFKGVLGTDPCPDDSGLRLSTRAGGLNTFYATGKIGDAARVRLAGAEAQQAKFYNMFSYQLGNAIVGASNTSTQALARYIDRQIENKIRSQSYQFFGTDPSLEFIAEERPEGRRGGAIIHIETPELQDAVARVASKTPIVEGKVIANGEVLNVLVNGLRATVLADGAFKVEIPLEFGRNPVAVIASTTQDEVLFEEFEIFYDGVPLRDAIVRGNNYLVVIANQDYDPASGFSDLSTPVGDGRRVAELMRDRFGFQTEAIRRDGSKVNLHLENATYRDVQLLLGDLAVIAQEEDTIVVFFAGHGEYSETTNTGYWLPTDALSGRLATYLDSKIITDTLLQSKARNALVISDSCYSGMLARGTFSLDEPETDDRTRFLQRLAGERSRVVLSSGGNEPVLDGGGDGHSVFARALIETLENPDLRAFSARELHDRVTRKVSFAAEQVPDFRAIRGAGHEGGDLVFVSLDAQ